MQTRRRQAGLGVAGIVNGAVIANRDDLAPPKAQGGRTQGVGIRFPADEKSRQLKLKIEEILGTTLGSDRQTQTL